RFGADGEAAAAGIVLNAPELRGRPHLPLALACRESLGHARQAGLVDGFEYAQFIDRLELVLGRRQHFGTQIHPRVDDELRIVDRFVAPLTDPGSVDARRAEIGLEPLNAQLAVDDEPLETLAWPVWAEWAYDWDAALAASGNDPSPRGGTRGGGR
ncbi:MAG: DUF6624 domain-containing protein, partial [Planctomycetota bacterium]